MNLHEQIVESFNSYISESESFDDNNVKVAGTRARKALGELTKKQTNDRLKVGLFFAIFWFGFGRLMGSTLATY